MDFKLILIASTAFLAVAGVMVASGLHLQARADLRRRLPPDRALASAENESAAEGGLRALVVEHFTEERYGVDSNLRQKLRLELIRAGFVNVNAVRYYVFARICSVIMFPIMVFLISSILIRDLPTVSLLLMVSISAGIGILAPDAFLSRLKNNLMAEYRLVFPDLLDLVNVCVSAGLSVEAAFDRVSALIVKRNGPLGYNIALFGAEIRAGRSTVEALNSFATRLGIDEAASFVSVLRQAVELGGDIATALRVFSEEMRRRRMLLAEKKANQLPVKLVLPLTLGIFPVILSIIMMPIIVKLLKVMQG